MVHTGGTDGLKLNPRDLKPRGFIHISVGRYSETDEAIDVLPSEPLANTS